MFSQIGRPYTVTTITTTDPGIKTLSSILCGHVTDFTDARLTRDEKELCEPAVFVAEVAW